MEDRATSAKIAAWRDQIGDLRRKIREAQATAAPDVVLDYRFVTPEGAVPLSALFGDKGDLFVVHSMGRSCPNCTLWADGFNGIYPHIADRAAFVIASPDPPDVQRSFAASRGWRIPMVSHQGTDFAADMGYRSPSGGWLPGLSVFRKDGDCILRIANTPFHEGDDFCTLWHLLDLLPDGGAGWQPRFSY